MLGSLFDLQLFHNVLFFLNFILSFKMLGKISSNFSLFESFVFESIWLNFSFCFDRIKKFLIFWSITIMKVKWDEGHTWPWSGFKESVKNLYLLHLWIGKSKNKSINDKMVTVHVCMKPIEWRKLELRSTRKLNDKLVGNDQRSSSEFVSSRKMH